MDTETTPNNHTINSPSLFMALELSNTQWRLGFTIGLGQPPRLRKLATGQLEGLREEIRLSKKRFGLPAAAPVMSCYEAGRDGFWLHRYLSTQGVLNHVVDSASAFRKPQRSAIFNPPATPSRVSHPCGTAVRPLTGPRPTGHCSAYVRFFQLCFLTFSL